MNFTAQMMHTALRRLDASLPRPIRLIVGGGGAMVLAHRFPLATADIDGIATGIEVSQLDILVKKVAKELGLPPDWLNPYFSTFTHVLPPDYDGRLEKVLSLGRLEVLALSKDDLLIMKCFAGRLKDAAHAKALIRKGARVGFVGDHIESLKRKRIPGAQEALDFLDDVADQLEGG